MHREAGASACRPLARRDGREPAGELPAPATPLVVLRICASDRRTEGAAHDTLRIVYVALEVLHRLRFECPGCGKEVCALPHTAMLPGGERQSPSVRRSLLRRGFLPKTLSRCLLTTGQVCIAILYCVDC